MKNSKALKRSCSSGLKPKSPFLSVFEYNRDLLKAAMANTYIETVGSKEDSSFKAFIIELYEMSNERVAREERKSARGTA
ncbi:MAG: hypothetical protein J7K81_08415 [Methanophagales archaeon]|nr:hypothetical protein [Methanophagales archaeon]